MDSNPATLQPLPEDGNVVVVLMLTPTRAVDLFLVDLQSRSRSETGRTAASYRRLLDHFTDTLPTHYDVADITPDDCRRFLAHYSHRAAGYRHTIYSTLNSFLEWLYRQQRIKRNPLDHVPRPRRVRPEDLDVIALSSQDVPKLLAVCQTHTERLAVAIPAYIGPRRTAIARLRLRDYDQQRRRIKFREKGSKTISKPVPDELAALLEWAIRDGAMAGGFQPGEPYLVPPEGPLTRRDRDDRVIWRVVTRVAARAGVEAHVHALRAAFATFYLEQNPDDLLGLQELLGHRSLETTRVYLRKLNRQTKMERVRSLSYGMPQFAVDGFTSSALMGAGGFEPPSLESALLERAARKPSPVGLPNSPASEVER